MGTPMSTVIAEQKEQEALAKDSLNSLQELAAAKLEAFHQDILTSGTSKDKQLPIKFVLLWDKSIQCSVSSTSTGIVDNVKSTVGAFASGDFVEGIGGILELGLKSVFGNYNGNSSEKQGHFVTVGPTLGFYRIDYYIYSYQFTSQALKDIATNVVCTSYVVSSIDTKEMDINTLRTVVGYSYGQLATQDGGQEKLMKIMTDCEAALKSSQNGGGQLTQTPALAQSEEEMKDDDGGAVVTDKAGSNQ